MPFSTQASTETSHVFATDGGDISVHPVSHASLVLETPVGTLYIDPVGEAEAYADFPNPDLILVTHEHGDHYKSETLAALVDDTTQMITSPVVYEMLPAVLKARAAQVANGESTSFSDMSIEAMPAYNITEERLNYHPQGRGNGYVLGFDGFRVYISGDTEDIPEMRRLQNIDLAFVCMNLPFTMDAEAAASAVTEFKPRFVYPYHYRGLDGGTQDPEQFAGLVSDDVDVRMGAWYD